jgi:alpha-mannosidase
MEQPFNEHVTQGLVAAGRVAVFSRGLPEFEVNRDEIELTLLRCVGRLSKDNLTSRRGGAGPGEPTPEAQCPGVHRFAYAITLLQDEDEVGQVRAAQAWRNGLVRSVSGLDTNGVLACADSGTVFSSLKGAEDGEGAIYRVWAAGEPARLEVKGQFTQMRRVSVREELIDEDGPELRPGQTASVRLTTG